jgi:hypothetical protein
MSNFPNGIGTRSITESDLIAARAAADDAIHVAMLFSDFRAYWFRWRSATCADQADTPETRSADSLLRSARANWRKCAAVFAGNSSDLNCRIDDHLQRDVLWLIEGASSEPGGFDYLSPYASAHEAARAAYGLSLYTALRIQSAAVTTDTVYRLKDEGFWYGELWLANTDDRVEIFAGIHDDALWDPRLAPSISKILEPLLEFDTVGFRFRVAMEWQNAVQWLRQNGKAGAALEPPKASGGEGTPSFDDEAAALAVLVKHPDWSVTKIAGKIGIDRSTLYRKACFMAAFNLNKASSQTELHRGGRSSNGQLEAFDR